MLRVITLNLNGIRSASAKGVWDWLTQQKADLICVQELKAQAADLSAEMLAPAGYHGHFHYAEKKGYSGVGIYSLRQPDNVAIGFGDSIRHVGRGGHQFNTVFALNAFLNNFHVEQSEKSTSKSEPKGLGGFGDKVE